MMEILEDLRKLITDGPERLSLDPSSSRSKCKHNSFAWEACAGCYDEAIEKIIQKYKVALDQCNKERRDDKYNPLYTATGERIN